MGNLYGPQAFTAGTFTKSSSFQTTDHGGADAPITGYPEFAAGEHIQTRDGLGPLGERVVDAYQTAPNYLFSGLAMLGLGDLASGEWDSTDGVTVEWDQYFSSTALNDAFSGQVLVLVARLTTIAGPSPDPEVGLSSGDSFIWIGFEQDAGANFHYDITYVVNGSNVNNTSVTDVADNAWHRVKIRYKPGTVTGALAGTFFPRAADGYLELLVDDVSLLSVTGIKLDIPTQSVYSTTPNLAYGAWHGFAGLIGPFTNFTLSSATIAMPTPGSLIDESEPCCGSTPGGSAAGPVLPPIDPAWTPECGGGGTVASAAEITPDEDWSDTTPPKEPDGWLTIHTQPYPVSSPSEAETIHWGTKPLSDTGRFVEGRLVEVGAIERGSSDKDGHYAPARGRFVALDDDGRSRTKLGDPAERHLLHCEGCYEVESYAGRKAGLDPIPVIQGRLVDIQPALDRRAVIEVQDIVGSAFGLLNPEKLIGLQVGDEHANLPDASRGKIYNILYGEHSDNGALDAEGNTAEKGMIPVVDCGDTDFAPSSPSGVMVSAPQNLAANKVGSATGSRTYHYGIVGLTEFGHTLMSNVVSVSNLPDSLDNVDYVELTWDAPATGAEFIIAYWVMGRTANPPNKRLDTMNGNNFQNPPETAYNDGKQGSRTDFDDEKSVNFKPIATAVASVTQWTWFAVALGAVDILSVYGSDIAEGGTPKRVKLDINAGDLLTPNSNDWPEPNPYRVVGGIRQTGFWARGTRVQHHRDGIVTFAVNVCGYKGVNGELINQAFRMLLSFLNEMVEKDDGVGYRDGAFGPIETFANGTPKFWTSKFEDAQDVTASWMGGSPSLGYLGAIAITEPTPLSEIIRRFFLTFGGHLTSDGYGRVYPFLVDTLQDVTAGQIFRERKEIIRLLDHTIAWKELENRLTYAYHYDYDSERFRATDLALEDATSIAAHGGERVGVFQTSLKECHYGNDPATMADRWQRHLDLYREPPRYVTWATNMEHLQRNNGDPARFSHRKEGIGATGETATPGVIMRTTVLGHAREIQHTVRLLESVGSP